MAATMNNARVLQVPPQPRWPSGDSRDLAVLRLAPAQLAERYGVTFAPGADDFDSYVVAAVDLDGEQAWLWRYDGSPDPGTRVMVDRDADPVTALWKLQHALELDLGGCSWVSAEAAPLGGRQFSQRHLMVHYLRLLLMLHRLAWRSTYGSRVPKAHRRLS